LALIRSITTGRFKLAEYDREIESAEESAGRTAQVFATA